MEHVSMYRIAPYGRWFFDYYWTYKGEETSKERECFYDFVHTYMNRDDKLYECLEQICICLIYNKWITIPRLKICFGRSSTNNHPVCDFFLQIHRNMEKYIKIEVEMGLIDVRQEYLTERQKHDMDTKL